MRVGFIGVGNIGRPMAQQIASAGFPLVVHDVRKDAAAALVQQGARWADSPSEVAAACDVVCTCLPGPAEMEEVALGERGIAQGIKPGAVYIDHTTNSPALVRKVHDVLSEKGTKMLDAPVSGGMEGAQTRDITVLVGGDEETLDGCRPVLDAMAKTVMHVGQIGAGSICKLMHNCAGFSVSLAMVECLALGTKAGVDPGVMIEVFQKCALGSAFQLHTRLPETLFRGNFEPRFAMSVAHKDMVLAAELARIHDVPMRLAEVSEQDMASAMSKGWGDRDSSIFLTLQEERAGVQVRVSD
jgi:3-hydroxyisobutyrate dehydrogenase